MRAVADDLIAVLTRFHREVLLPDVKRVVGQAMGELRAEMNAHFDAINKRFDGLESEYHRLEAPGHVPRAR
jgi:hypothetical protein